MSAAQAGTKVGQEFKINKYRVTSVFGSIWVIAG